MLSLPLPTQCLHLRFVLSRCLRVLAIASRKFPSIAVISWTNSSSSSLILASASANSFLYAALAFCCEASSSAICFSKSSPNILGVVLCAPWFQRIQRLLSQLDATSHRNNS
ncbi:uncharacterized protein BCR38DRAFT_427334 [Pseudomassariella vexata]|uniref:Uncharacterized protein n=1 Tax=Pseudomassariella vexata TaxID=1141098 RepID=A0A1Y2E7I4_9PEZI|nr:uncharacterized protein BCR38DRAFT_427334 [Pseudomassariella vexata]ORY67521.1 hypothetical protein BCR38DRAFT_427334 [Pseudomassariella vexata]